MLVSTDFYVPTRYYLWYCFNKKRYKNSLVRSLFKWGWFMYFNISLCITKSSTTSGYGGFCGDVPCTLQYANYFGFVTIPFLAGIAFIIIFVCHLILLKEGKKHEK